jgi:phosphatidylinositol-3-phosphatase
MAAVSAPSSALAGTSQVALTPSPVQTPAPHVMLIVEENRSESAVIGAPGAPYINALAKRYGLATASYGQSHPSLPNYLELLSGSTWGVTDDGTGYSFTGTTLADQLQRRGIRWRAYMESMPGPCYRGAGINGYAKKHDPFLYFSNIVGSASSCGNVVPYVQLHSDLSSGAPPDFMWVTPNLCDDGHDCSTATMDGWLAANLPAVLASAWFAEDGVVIITWDEGSDGAGCCAGAHGGRIATVVVSSRRYGPATSTTPVDHAGTLRTIEELYGLPFLRDAGCTCSGDLMSLVESPPSTLTWLSAPHFR